MRRRWHLAPADADSEIRLCRELGMSTLFARLLAVRGVRTPEAANAFLNTRLSEHLRSPMLFRDMAAAAERVIAALRDNERIGIYGDYDADGISGSALLIRFLRTFGCAPALYIPHRLRDGYGVSEPGVRLLAEQGVRLMITVDCGGVSHREIDIARRLGMDTIVCDHHQVSGTPLPACAVLNPIEPDAGFPFQGLCGAGVAFYLTMGVRLRMREAGHSDLPDLRHLLELVTIGTVADLVPITDENRVMVKHGLRALSHTASPGLVALKAVAGVTAVSARAVGFRLAPRLNAGGRLADATRSVELLTSTDASHAAALAAGLDDENRARQRIEQEMFTDAVGELERLRDVAERRSIVLASADWHPGVVGIVASRLVERFYRPTVLIAIDPEQGVSRGSGRSIHGLHLYQALAMCRALLEGFGGHRMAAGLSIRPERIGAFAEQFEAAVCALTQPGDFVPQTTIDGELSFSQIDDRLLDDLDRLEPHGTANPQPLFLTRQVLVTGRRVVGDRHLKLSLRHGDRVLSAIGFGMAEAGVGEGAAVDIVFAVERNEWNGTTTTQLRLRDFRLVGTASGPQPAVSAT